MVPFAALVLALALGALGQGVTIPNCGTITCTEFAVNCVSGGCVCRPQFTDITCNTHFYMLRPDYFNGFYSMCIVLSVLCLMLGVFLALYYFCRFVPKAKQHNAQIISIFMVSLAALLRLIEAAVSLGYGNTVVRSFFYRQPNAVQGVLRLSLRLYYPLVLGAFTMQVLMWVEFVLAVKSLKPVAATWSPRLRCIMVPALVFLFVLETTVQLLLLFNIENPIVFYVYRALITAYIVALLLTTIIFGIRLYQVLNHKGATPSKMGSRARASRASITRLIVASCVLLFLGLCFAVSDTVFRMTNDFDIFWAYTFVERLIEMALMLSVLMTALSMMRNRIAYSNTGIPDHGLENELSPASDQPLLTRDQTKSGSFNATKKSGGASSGGSSSGGGAGRSSSVRGANKEASDPPLMDYSAFGSAVEEEDGEEMATTPLRISAQTIPKSERKLTEGPMPAMLDAPSAGALAYAYQPGELGWAQYRMDGLWYAARVDTLGKDEVAVEYLDYGLSDTLPLSSVCPDFNGYLTGDRLNPIKAFDSRPSEEQLKESNAAGAVQPDTFGLVRLRGKQSKKPNHASLLLRRTSTKQ